MAIKSAIQTCHCFQGGAGKTGSVPRTFIGSLIITVTLASLLTGCATHKSVAPQAGAERCRGEQAYFPAGTFPADYPGSDRSRRKWYSAVLARLNEPSLSCPTGDSASYRLIWLNSLANPVVIRITRQGRNVTLDAFQLSGTGAGDPGLPLHRLHKQLSVVDWGMLQAILSRSHFRDLPTSGNMYSLHGEQWIVEGRDEAGYHIVDRWSPPAGSYRDLGVIFFDMAGWQRPYSSKY
ncbi:hypothetical protein [Ferrovibrio xuzhouensis]|uniref:Lipoprotein n=1 Tax=Ferrovibrio xuzhouensis TaxID=1576914 RepID=A0ABV7VBR1_9PROT